MASESKAPDSNRVNVDALTRMLQCPVSLETYSDRNKAVTLVAAEALGRVCGHTVSERTAEQLFLAAQPTCPLCRAVTVRYVPNPTINDLARELFSKDAAKSNAVLPAISAKIPAESEPDIGSIPFPGTGARFEIEQNYDLDCWGQSLLLSFSSTSPNSLFSCFMISGNKNGKIEKILIMWRTEEANRYFIQCGIADTPQDSVSRSYGFYSPSDMKKVFKILAVHNEIPEPHFGLIRGWIETGRWK